LRSGGCGSALNFARQLPSAVSGLPCASPLIQVAAMVRPPEGLTITLPSSVLASHLASPRLKT
jgi:hypothetical protein